MDEGKILCPYPLQSGYNMQSEYVWGFLPPSAIVDLGHIGVNPSKYQFLLDNSKFHEQMASFLYEGEKTYQNTFTNREVAEIQLGKRIHILLLVAIVLGDMKYYEEALELMDDPIYSELWPKNMVWETTVKILTDNFNKKWVDDLQSCLTLWKKCPGFVNRFGGDGFLKRFLVFPLANQPVFQFREINILINWFKILFRHRNTKYCIGALR